MIHFGELTRTLSLVELVKGLVGSVSHRSHNALVQTIALSGAGEGGFDSGEMLRLSLELAAATDADTDAGFEQLNDAAAAIVRLLEADDQGFQTWPVRLPLAGDARCMKSDISARLR